MSNFWRKITNFYQLSEWNENSQYVCFITLVYSSTFYSLFLSFFVLEIFKFKYDKVFVGHSASISKFQWFEQLWEHGYDLVWPTFCSKFCPNILHWKPAKKKQIGCGLGAKSRPNYVQCYEKSKDHSCFSWKLHFFWQKTSLKIEKDS